MEAVKLKNINKSFNGKKVLNNVNLNIYQNEIFGLIGRNGAGKSTLLHIISGIIYKTSGEVLVSNNKNPEKIKKKNEALNAVGEVRRTIKYLKNSINS